jgi:hypothetical protein
VGLEFHLFCLSVILSFPSVADGGTNLMRGLGGPGIRLVIGDRGLMVVFKKEFCRVVGTGIRS